jgi:flagellar hook assembly protein FlgD
VALTIYNLAGQEVATPVHEHLAAGVHTVRWNARTSTGEAAGSGVYIYRMQTPASTLSRKLLLLR